MSRQEVVSLLLPQHLRARLLEAGFTHVGELERAHGPLELARDAGISPEEAAEVMQLVSYGGGAARGADWRAGTVSAASLYAAAQATPRVTLLCRELDRLLGGGVALGQVTEFCGVPGIGKTQIGIQLAVNVQIPASMSGLGGHAVYVDTEGSFMAERCADMAEGTLRHLRAVAGRLAAAGRPQWAEALAAAGPDLSVESILKGIFYFRIHDAAEQLALVQLLPQFLAANPGVRLLVFDSITFHFRQDFSDMAARTRCVTAMAQHLIAAAQAHGVAVVLMNQVTTKVLDGGGSKLVPALGESWGHAASSRVMLHWGRGGGERTAQLFKSPGLPPGEVPFAVTADGVRSVAGGGGTQRR